MIPNTPPAGQVGVIPGTVVVAGLAVAQLLGRDAGVVHCPAGSGWSVQALLDQRASLDASALIRAMSLSESESWPLISVSIAQEHRGTMLPAQ